MKLRRRRVNHDTIISKRRAPCRCAITSTRTQRFSSGKPCTAFGRRRSWRGSIPSLPKEYIAQPRVRLGTMMEIDVGALERESGDLPPAVLAGKEALPSPLWAPAAPAILLDTELPEPDEYEVNIYSQDEFRLVAAIELVSPSNKDRSENRRTLVNKCESLLKREVCVTIVDPVTSRAANVYGELLDELDAPRTAVSRSVIYAATCRGPSQRATLAARVLGTQPRHRDCTANTSHLAIAGPLGPLGIGGDLRGDLSVVADSVRSRPDRAQSRRIRRALGDGGVLA